MDTLKHGQLVTVAGAGPNLDGIVFDTPSPTKVVVAVVDPQRGPVFRTVQAADVSAREEEAPTDRALHLLIRRTPAPAHGAARAAASSGRGRAGFGHVTGHRTTGK